MPEMDFRSFALQSDRPGMRTNHFDLPHLLAIDLHPDGPLLRLDLQLIPLVDRSRQVRLHDLWFYMSAAAAEHAARAWLVKLYLNRCRPDAVLTVGEDQHAAVSINIGRKLPLQAELKLAIDVRRPEVPVWLAAADQHGTIR